jgi:predicted PurR-regulated permease PerM
MLYFARVVFIPLALAILFSLFLSPIVTFFERIKFPRPLAVVLVVSTLIGLISLLLWQSSQQFFDLTNQLPAYKETLVKKIHTLKRASGESLNKASDVLNDVEKEIVSATPGAPGSDGKKPPTAGGSPSRPMTVQVVAPANPLESFQNLLGPLASAVVVIVFTIFILLGREDLRNRLIRLVAGNRLNVMTQAMDEASQRINRYLFLQLLVNAGYGTVVAIGLHYIGIPNAGLWGVASAILRFLPYVGAPLAASAPIVLALAIFPGWQQAAITAGFFVVLEMLVANLLEPLLYGSHVGLSPLAILVAAVFWTLIWGFPGLVLSTPLTVCLMVMGRHVPSLNVLNVILGDEPVLEPHALFYQRLLAGDENEAREVLENRLKEKSLESVYGEVVIPALRLAEHDRHRNELDEDAQNFIYQSTREIVEDVAEIDAERTAENNETRLPAPVPNIQNALSVMCIPARDEADDVVAAMLARLLEKESIRAQSIPIGTTSEMLGQVMDAEPDVVCISALPPFAIDHSRALYVKLRTRVPKIPIMVCVWHSEANPQKIASRLRLASGDALFTTLTNVVQHLEVLNKQRSAAEVSS